jgi:tetratricopeptide (TPR) repeat protein
MAKNKSCLSVLIAAAIFICGATALSAQQQNLPANPNPPLLFGESNLAVNPAARRRALDLLYEQLKRASTPESVAMTTEAIERLWLESGSPTANLLMERAFLAFRAQNLDLTIEILRSLTAVAPGYAQGWAQLGLACMAAGKDDEAQPALLRALAIEPGHFNAVEAYAVLLRRKGDKQAALAAFRRALALNPHSAYSRTAEAALTREVEGRGI